MVVMMLLMYGPFGQIFEYQLYGEISSNIAIPLWLAGCGGIAIGIGFILFGKGVLYTVGDKIAKVIINQDLLHNIQH